MTRVDKGDIDHPMPWQEEDLLRDILQRNYLPTSVIAEDLGCSPVTLRKYIREYDIDWQSPRYSFGPYKVSFKHLHSIESPYEVWEHKNHTVRVHRLMAVAKFGFDALEDKDVHHKSHIPWDNRMENISVMKRSEHRDHHQNGDPECI